MPFNGCLLMGATVRNKTVIDSEGVQGHYLPVTSMVLEKGGRDDLGERIF